MNINKMLYKNRYEINKIFNMLKLKKYSINICVDKSNKHTYNIKKISINNMFLYKFIEFDISLNVKYCCFIKNINQSLFLIDSNINLSLLFNDINYIGNNIVTGCSNYIHYKYFIQLLQNILNL